MARKVAGVLEISKGTQWYAIQAAHWIQREILPRLKKGLKTEDVLKIWPSHYLLELLLMEGSGFINKTAVGQVTAIIEREYYLRSENGLPTAP